MLKRIKKKTGFKIYELAKFLGVIRQTIKSWEVKRRWPLWALEKCGFEVIEIEDLLLKFREMDVKEGNYVEIIVWKSHDGKSDVTHKGILVFDETALCIKHFHHNCETLTPIRNYSYNCEFRVIKKECVE